MFHFISRVWPFELPTTFCLRSCWVRRHRGSWGRSSRGWTSSSSGSSNRSSAWTSQILCGWASSRCCPLATSLFSVFTTSFLHCSYQSINQTERRTRITFHTGSGNEKYEEERKLKFKVETLKVKIKKKFKVENVEKFSKVWKSARSTEAESPLQHPTRMLSIKNRLNINC